VLSTGDGFGAAFARVDEALGAAGDGRAGAALYQAQRGTETLCSRVVREVS